MGRHCFGPQVSSVNLRTDGWISPLLHPIGFTVSNAGLAIDCSLSPGGCTLLCVLFFFPCTATVHFFRSNRALRMFLPLFVSRRTHVRRAALPEYGKHFR